MTTKPVCPRCGHLIPRDSDPGAYPGALSRKDNATEVCSVCGLHEGLLAAEGVDVSEQEWPVDVPAELYSIG